MNDNDGIAADFKHPSRWPVVFVLLIIACVVAGRWYVKKQREMKCPVGIVSTNIVSSSALPVKPAVKAGQPHVQPGLVTNTMNVTHIPAHESDPATAVSSLTDSNIYHVVQQAMGLEERKALVEARIKYISVLRTIKDQVLRADVEQRLSRINCEIVLTPLPMPEKQQHVVKSGDSLEKIARKYGTTVELIRKSNLLSSDVIKIEDRLMILTGTFAIIVRKAKNDMLVTLNDEFFAKYAVGTGKFGKTPVGSFVINDKIKEPVWWRPDGKEIPFGDPANILGTRWMSIKASGSGTPEVSGYGIHGTWDEGSIGKAESAGCIRMKNSEVEQLFMMVPLGTVVTITEQ